MKSTKSTTSTKSTKSTRSTTSTKSTTSTTSTRPTLIATIIRKDPNRSEIKPTTTSALSSTTTTTLPPEILNLPSKERDLNASKLIIKDNMGFKDISDELPRLMNDVLNSGTAGYKTQNNFFIINVQRDVIIQSSQQINNTWNKIESSTDLNALRDEIIKIIEYQVEKKLFDQNLTLLNQALDALEKKEGNKFLSFLKSAGKSTYEIAKDIGTELLSKILKEQLGL